MLFFKYLWQLIPKVPTFDIRTSLVLMSIGIPFLLDILTVFFALPIFKAIFHILDLGAAFGISYLATLMLIPPKVNTFYILGIVLLSAYLIGRVLFHFFRKKEDFTVKDATRELSNFYFDGIIPNFTENLTLSEINQKLSSIMSTVQIVPKVAAPSTIFMLYCIFLLLIVVSLILLDVIKLDITIPPAVRLFLPYILLPFAVITFVLMFLKATEAGAKFLLSVKKFIKRWGLRLLLLAFELLYIPIMTGLMYNFVPVSVKCPQEGFIPIRIPSNSTFYQFETHYMTCVNQSTLENMSSFSLAITTKLSKLRMRKELSLSFVQDILKVNGGIMLFTIAFIMIGIPAFWVATVNVNRDFVFGINVFGRTPEEKWAVLTTKLETTGIFLFQKYTVYAAKWSVWLILAKFIIMILSAIGNSYYTKLVVLLPIFYLCMAVATYLKWPYLCKLNNWLDFVLYIFNLIFALFPVLSGFNVIVPEKIVTIVSLAVLSIPAVSCVLFLFCVNKDNMDDPTLITKEVKEEIDRIEEERLEKLKQEAEEAERAKNGRRSSAAKEKKPKSKILQGSSSKGDDDEEEDFEEDYDDDNYDDDDYSSGDYSTHYEKSFERDNEQAFKAQFETVRYDEEFKRQMTELETVEIGEGWLNSIYDMKNNQLEKGFKVKKVILAMRFRKYYEMLDLIIDAQTIAKLVFFLNLSSVFACFAMGWFIRALLSTMIDHEIQTNVQIPADTCKWLEYFANMTGLDSTNCVM
ncbi:hypothetical protein TVAG_154810 [Trichomonas vaginalis G3]|uniref:Uncharacterized protein n=1 Tax=Trichomonas vaginalis (strain ATCC PRA-98 / G3) TaxID=412133 RepID=A2F272_TRIV3|nr:hypothetical protein TVAGG3_0163710 [Trichomonas vaginalis G3]EAY01011.1 hypothetical protein TVAG_154810 [Trichomonas vaginalis G3]KAI5548054.1 hypothetical protein TVAGG3_0163710 [Trichomonas vaginalis G3]|eukprot:XP_001330068.1 hypothetical protein [Trichomonas vaginalis G3]